MNVIGPITKKDWRTMRDIRESMKMMTRKDRIKYADALEFENELYMKRIRKYVPGEAAA